MRATRTTSIVVVTSSLIAASVVAQPKDAKKVDPKAAAGSGSAGSGSATPTPADAGSGSAVAAINPADVPPSDMPTPVRMRRLEQKTQALKERAWQLKARVQMLKEQMIGGGVGAQAVIAHASEMGSSFRLTRIVFALDGTQVFARTDETGEALYKTKSFDVFSGPIAPGNHNLVAQVEYRGHGYGVFEYLSKYTFTANGTQSFTAVEGKITKVDCKGYEKGGPTTPLEKRAAVECKVTTAAQKDTATGAPATAPAPTTPTTPTTEPAK